MLPQITKDIFHDMYIISIVKAFLQDKSEANNYGKNRETLAD
jgi:hypothetical protein